MRIKRIFVLCLLPLLIMLIIGALSTLSTSFPDATLRSSGQLGTAFQDTSQSPATTLGIKAITPRLMNKTPSYTKEDVREYLQREGFAGGPLVAGKEMQIGQIMFTSTQQIQKITGEEIGLPDNAIVCYVI